MVVQDQQNLYPNEVHHENNRFDDKIDQFFSNEYPEFIENNEQEKIQEQFIFTQVKDIFNCDGVNGGDGEIETIETVQVSECDLDDRQPLIIQSVNAEMADNTIVYVADYGDKYHSKPQCENNSNLMAFNWA